MLMSDCIDLSTDTFMLQFVNAGVQFYCHYFIYQILQAMTISLSKQAS